jgi:hypothetical protein
VNGSIGDETTENAGVPEMDKEVRVAGPEPVLVTLTIRVEVVSTRCSPKWSEVGVTTRWALTPVPSIGMETDG